MKTEQSRRSFFATMALGVSASAFPMMLKDYEQLESFDHFSSSKLKDAESWFKKLKERIVSLMMEPTSRWFTNNLELGFYHSNNETGSPDSDITAMTVLRHSNSFFI